MTKLKNPLMSLKAHGSVADSLTFVERAKTTVAEKKPHLPYFLTLPVQYQRWLYQDYAYLWTQQSDAVKATYRGAGVRFHLTGFQYWMKYHLTTLPDIVAWWRFDDNHGVTTGDSSKNTNPLTVFGASPSTLAIDGAFLFDGINDCLQCADKPELRLGTQNFTITAFIKTSNLATNQNIVMKRAGALWWELRTLAGIGRLRLDLSAVDFVWSAANFCDGNLHHLAALRDFSGNTARVYLDGLDDTLAVLGNMSQDLSNAANVVAGSWQALADWWAGWIDDIRIYNRLLDDTELLRHSGRRYPLK